METILIVFGLIALLSLCGYLNNKITKLEDTVGWLHKEYKSQARDMVEMRERVRLMEEWNDVEYVASSHTFNDNSMRGNFAHLKPLPPDLVLNITAGTRSGDVGFDLDAFMRELKKRSEPETKPKKAVKKVTKKKVVKKK